MKSIAQQIEKRKSSRTHFVAKANSKCFTINCTVTLEEEVSLLWLQKQVNKALIMFYNFKLCYNLFILSFIMLFKECNVANAGLLKSFAAIA
jgi:hypothetical protein